jgi:hypothetical protein
MCWQFLVSVDGENPQELLKDNEVVGFSFRLPVSPRGAGAWSVRANQHRPVSPAQTEFSLYRASVSGPCNDFVVVGGEKISEDDNGKRQIKERSSESKRKRTKPHSACHAR